MPLVNVMSRPLQRRREEVGSIWDPHGGVRNVRPRSTGAWGARSGEWRMPAAWRRGARHRRLPARVGAPEVSSIPSASPTKFRRGRGKPGGGVRAVCCAVAAERVKDVDDRLVAWRRGTRRRRLPAGLGAPKVSSICSLSPALRHKIYSVSS
jgi:hypothetical protein